MTHEMIIEKLAAEDKFIAALLREPDTVAKLILLKHARNRRAELATVEVL